MPPPPISAPHVFTPAPSINNFKQESEKYIIDNNTLYKKLIDLENEIKVLKNMISTINFPKPAYYPMQSTSYGAPPSPMSHNINSYIYMKPNQSNYL
jgi:retron-type reverse transcriptase